MNGCVRPRLGVQSKYTFHSASNDTRVHFPRHLAFYLSFSLALLVCFCTRTIRINDGNCRDVGQHYHAEEMLVDDAQVLSNKNSLSSPKNDGELKSFVVQPLMFGRNSEKFTEIMSCTKSTNSVDFTDIMNCTRSKNSIEFTETIHCTRSNNSIKFTESMQCTRSNNSIEFTQSMQCTRRYRGRNVRPRSRRRKTTNVFLVAIYLWVIRSEVSIESNLCPALSNLSSFYFFFRKNVIFCSQSRQRYAFGSLLVGQDVEVTRVHRFD